MVKNLPCNAGDTGDRHGFDPCLGRKNPLEEEMVTYFSILAWKIPRTEEPGGGPQSVGSQRVQTTNPEKISTAHIISKGLIPRICKEFLLVEKKNKPPSFKQAKT